MPVTEQEKRILETAIRTEMSGRRTEVSMRKNSFGETVILVLMVILDEFDGDW